MRDKKLTSKSPNAGIVLMDVSLQPLAIDRGAAAILATPSHYPDGAYHSGAYPNGGSPIQIPADILKLIRDRIPGDLSSFETHFLNGNCEYVCRAYLVEPQAGVSLQPIVALHFERHCAEADVVHSMAIEHNLTNREQEALRGISMGFSSKELAERMNISPNTARAFSRLIMIKMDVRSRAGVAAKLLQYTRTKSDRSAAETNFSRDWARKTPVDDGTESGSHRV